MPSDISPEASLSKTTEPRLRNLGRDNADSGIHNAHNVPSVRVGDGDLNIARNDRASDDLLRRHNYYMTCVKLAPESGTRQTDGDAPDARSAAQASECYGDAPATTETSRGLTDPLGGRASEVSEPTPCKGEGEDGYGLQPQASEGKCVVQFLGNKCDGDQLEVCNSDKKCNDTWTHNERHRPTFMPLHSLSAGSPSLNTSPSDPSTPEEFFDAPDELLSPGEGVISSTNTRENYEDFDDFKDALDTQPKDFLNKERYSVTRENVTNYIPGSSIIRKGSPFVRDDVNIQCEGCDTKTLPKTFGVQGHTQASTGAEVSGITASDTREELEVCHSHVSQNSNSIGTPAKELTHSNDYSRKFTAGDTSLTTDNSRMVNHESIVWKPLVQDKFQCASDEKDIYSQMYKTDTSKPFSDDSTSMDERDVANKKYSIINRRSTNTEGMEKSFTNRPGRLPKADPPESQREKSEAFLGNLKPSGFRLREKFVQIHERSESSLNEETRKIVKMLENDKACRVPRYNVGLQDRLQSLMQRSECKRPAYNKRPKFCSTLVKTIVRRTTDRIESHTDPFEDFIRQRKEPPQTNHMTHTAVSNDNKENVDIRENYGDNQHKPSSNESQDITDSITSNSTLHNEAFPTITDVTFFGRSWSPCKQIPHAEKDNSKSEVNLPATQRAIDTGANEVVSHQPLSTVNPVNSDLTPTDRYHLRIQGLDVSGQPRAKQHQRSKGDVPMDIYSEKGLVEYQSSNTPEQMTIGAKEGESVLHSTLTTELPTGSQKGLVIDENLQRDIMCEMPERNVRSDYVKKNTESYIQHGGLSETGEDDECSEILEIDETRKSVDSMQQSTKRHTYSTRGSERIESDAVMNNSIEDLIFTNQKPTKVESAMISETAQIGAESSLTDSIAAGGTESIYRQNQPPADDVLNSTINDSRTPIRTTTMDDPPTTGLPTHTTATAPHRPSLTNSSISTTDISTIPSPPITTAVQPTMADIDNFTSHRAAYEDYRRGSLSHEAGNKKTKSNVGGKKYQHNDSDQNIDLKQHIASLNKVSSKLMNKVKDQRPEQPDYRASLSTSLKVAVTQAVTSSPARTKRPGLKKMKNKVEPKERPPKTKKQEPQSQSPSSIGSSETHDESSSSITSPEPYSESSSSITSPEPYSESITSMIPPDDEISQEFDKMASSADYTIRNELDALSPSSQGSVTLDSLSSDELESPSTPPDLLQQSPTPEIPVTIDAKPARTLPLNSTISRPVTTKAGSVPTSKTDGTETSHLDKQITVPENMESEQRTLVPDAVKPSQKTLLVSEPTRPTTQATSNIKGSPVVTENILVPSDIPTTSTPTPASGKVPEASSESHAWQRRKAFVSCEIDPVVKEDPQKRWNESAILQLKTKNMVLRHCSNSTFPLPVTRGRRDTSRKLWTQAVKPMATKEEPQKPASVPPKLTEHKRDESPHGKRRSSLLGERRDSSHKVRRKQSNGNKHLEDLTVHLFQKSNADEQINPCSKQNSFDELPPIPPCNEENASRHSLPHGRRESREKVCRSRQGSVAELNKASRRSSREGCRSSHLNSRRGSADRNHAGSRRATKASFSENLLRKCLEVAIDRCEQEDMEVNDDVPLDKMQMKHHESLDKSLSRAVARNNVDKVRELLNLGANPNISAGHVPALLRAARDGALYVVQALLGAGADVDARTDQGNSALHEASRVGHNEVVICLVYSNAYVDAINRNGVTPLQTALSYGQVEVVQTLIRFNADVHLKNKVGESALTIAEHLGYVGLSGSNTEVRRYSGPGTCAPVAQMEVPVSVQLILGLEEGCPLTVENCLSQGASCNTLVPLALHWPAYATVLHRAAHHGDDLIARLLLQSGANVNARDVVGNTPLHAAAQAGHNRVVKLLLANGAQLEATSRSGMTPLHRAASKGKELTCNLLLRRGANTRAEDSEGRTPADWATKRGFKSVARKLGHRRRSSSGLIAEQQHKAYIKYLDELYQASHLESSRASPSPEPAPA
ncbi:uncharacterized protein LOC122265984 [Penaeus japonicus]|uniref:uncharacterized protein LOC122265984 n=1 Tax=Penaeus japonicus TaxID=27405 RepID=UPI001C717754|nr:uncharacterized protein LOC122265984 [Penaeus japonicus]